MNKIYNLKQEKTAFQETPTISEFQNHNKQNRRKNSILNGFVFMIGFVGFLSVFMLPRDLVYNRTSLENSFSNTSNNLASSSAPMQTSKKHLFNLDVENQVQINGYREANEMLEFHLENFQSNSDVDYTIHFGNGDKKVITSKSTYYQYPSSGNYEVRITAIYQGETKNMWAESIFVDDAILVNTEAFSEFN